jgi:hypothetical protein
MEKLEYVNPQQIEVHPILKGFPALTGEQFSALLTSIAQNGVLEPITCVRDGSGILLVVDGRHRLAAAREAELKTIPAYIREDTYNLAEFVLEKAITGRQLTKTAICFLLLEKHPNLASDREDRKGGRPVNRPSKTVDLINSYRPLAEKYHVPFEYFSRILGVQELCRSKSKDWDRVRHMVFADEVCANRLASALGGWQAEHPLGKPVGDDAVAQEVKRKGAINVEDGLIRSIMFLRNQGKHWHRLPEKIKIKAHDMWHDTIVNLPDDILEFTETSVREALAQRKRDKKNRES